jgi:membrane protease YdiL (CAAX protease family)
VLLAATTVIGRVASNVLENGVALLFINLAGLFIASAGATWLSVRFVDHRPPSTFGIGFIPRWRKDCVFGIAVAVGMLAVVMAGCYAVGYVSMRWTAGLVPVSALTLTFGTLVAGAAHEELLFRGYPLQVLIEGVGHWPAIILMSLGFGLLHVTNPNASFLGTVNTVVAGILLSIAYVRARSLWLPYAIHLSWNLGIGFVFGFALSGIDLASLWTTGTAGSETILGGGYGPEGGLLGTFVFGAAAVIVNRHGSIDTTQADTGGGSRGSDRPGT